jgi:uncharacterized membrane protein AbrB (regulator of aidB expression)
MEGKLGWVVARIMKIGTNILVLTPDSGLSILFYSCHIPFPWVMPTLAASVCILP